MITDSEKLLGFGVSFEGEAVVTWDCDRMVTEGDRGLSGVAGRECWRYQANTEFVY